MIHSLNSSISLEEESLHVIPRVNVGTIGPRAFRNGCDPAVELGLADRSSRLEAAVLGSLSGGQESAGWKMSVGSSSPMIGHSCAPLPQVRGG
jgi:hypothetical protein